MNNKMKHLKTFESYVNEASKIDFHLANEIAEDLYPQLVKRQNEGELITPEYFERFIIERGLDISSVDLIMSELVNMGFDFDIEEEEDSFDQLEIKKI